MAESHDQRLRFELFFLSLTYVYVIIIRKQQQNTIFTI